MVNTEVVNIVNKEGTMFGEVQRVVAECEVDRNGWTGVELERVQEEVVHNDMHLKHEGADENKMSAVEDELLSIHQVFVKSERIVAGDDDGMIAGEEIVLGSVSSPSEMLPVMVDDPSTSMVEEIIHTGDGDEDGLGEECDEDGNMNVDMHAPDDGIQTLHNMDSPTVRNQGPMRGRRNQIKYKVISGDTDFSLNTESDGYGRKIVDKDDPRSRLHFVKYLKRDGKTLKIWECGICSKEFRHQYTLMRHLPTHTDERNFKCETCGKAFRQMSTLSQHRAIHSDARPYVCELCKKTFNRVSTLISHRKTHSEHKPHKCQMCGKGFHQKGNLRNHVFTHTNERPYKCEVCGKGFNQMSNLMCHKSHSHDAEKPRYVCKLCQKEFPQRFALRSHEEYKHGIKYRGGERRQEVDPIAFQEMVERRQRKREQKSMRVVQLPNGDRTLADTKSTSPASGVVIDPINTRAMVVARQAGQTPFALLKPALGIPVLVKVMPAAGGKQMLVPATAEDLRSAGKVTVSPGQNSRAVQIKVPVVATVVQREGPDGQLTIEVEPPGPEAVEEEIVGEEPEEEEDEDTVEEVAPRDIGALVEAIRSAGYHVSEGSKQIVITDDEPHILYGDAEQIMLGEAPIEMVIDDDGPLQFVIQEATS